MSKVYTHGEMTIFLDTDDHAKPWKVMSKDNEMVFSSCLYLACLDFISL